MRILLLTSRFNVGGIATYMVTLAKGLIDRGHQVIVACGPGNAAGWLADAGLTHWPIGLRTKNEWHPSVGQITRGLTRRLKESPVDIIHAQSRVSHCIADRLWRQHKIPYVTTSHGLLKARWNRRMFPCWGLRTVAISEPVREHLVNHFRLLREQVAMIPNGVDLAAYRHPAPLAEMQALRRSLDIPPDASVVTITSRLVEVKGHQHLLCGAPDLLAKHPRTVFLIAGGGPKRKILQEIAREMGVDRHVRWLGERGDVPNLLQMTDVFVHPATWQEGFGLSILEAMAAGCPVVATNVGGVYMLVQEGDNGYLVPPGDPAGLSQKIRWLLDDSSLRRQMGEKSRQLAQAFSKEVMAAALEKLYQDVIDHAHARL